MELLLQVRPEPASLKTALQALRLAESRLSIALEWIKRFHGKLPNCLRSELRRAEGVVTVSDGKARTNPATTKSNGPTRLLQLPAVTAPSLPEFGGQDDDDWGNSSPASPENLPLSISTTTSSDAALLPASAVRQNLITALLPGSAVGQNTADEVVASAANGAGHTVSTSAAHGTGNMVTTTVAQRAPEIVSTSHGIIKIVDIRKITDQSANNDPDVDVKPEPLPLPVHTCPHCPVTFESAQALSVHALVHAKLPVNRMGISQQSLDLVLSQPSLYSIRRLNDKLVVVKKANAPGPSIRKNPDRGAKSQFQCDLCPRTFSSEHVFTYHLTHIHKRPKPCHICSLRFTTSRERNEHLKTEHPELSCHKCAQCEATFISQDRLKNHVHNVHTDPSLSIACEVCGKLCKSETTLNYHIRTSHPDADQAVLCPTCGIQVKSAARLKTHMISHGPASFLCQLCGHAAKQKTSLEKHMKTVHTTARLCKCPHCPLSFKDTSRLKNHVDRHFGKNITKCPYCDVQKNRHDLHNHISIIHKGRKFKCAQCPSMFSLRAHLKNHYVLKHPDVTIPPDADLEVIYTKNPEDTTTAPPPAKKARGPTGPRSAKSRDSTASILSCATCPGAVFNSRHEFELHTLRHEKDPDYTMRHPVPVQRLDQPPPPEVTSDTAPNNLSVSDPLPPTEVASNSDPRPMHPQPVSQPQQNMGTAHSAVSTTSHQAESEGQLLQPIPQYFQPMSGNTVGHQYNPNPIPNPYQVELDFNALAFHHYTNL